MAGEGDETTRGFRVRGRVQGVGFRWWTQRTAERLGLDGTVRNCPDGSVEVHVRGPQKVVDRLEALLEEGPAGSRVEEVARIPADPPPSGGGFRITG